MNDSLFVADVLREIFPVECDTVGPTNLEDIAEGGVDFATAEGGSYMDLGDAIATLVVAAALVKSVLEAYVVYKKEIEDAPKREELEVRIVTSNEAVDALDEKTRDLLVEAVVRKLKDK